MHDPVDVAVVGQDPWVRGGYRSQAEAFWRASRELGREPHLFCIAHDRALSLVRHSLALAPRPATGGVFGGTSFPALLPEIGSVNHLVNARRMGGAVRTTRSVWVVTTSAHYGFAAVASRRPYACWVGTGFMEETEARRHGLPPQRRLALELNAPLFRRLEREVLRQAAVVCATSPASRRAVMAAADLPPERVKLLPISIDTERFRPEPDDRWRQRLEKPILVFVGRARDPRKNVGLLVEAFRRIRLRVPRVRLRLVGQPPARALLRGLPDETEVVGEVESVHETVRANTLFVMPSLQEGFGVAVAEALASGVPAVVTPCGGPEEMIRGSGGGRVLSGFSADELAEAVVELLADPARLLAMRRSGRDYVAREHAPRRHAQLLADAFAELETVS
jgi:glycosyltransferase involved in cell wall biosynthesis